MKKLLLLALAAIMALSCVACGPATTEDPSKKSEGVMTYAEYAAAEFDSKVVIEAYVQAKQGHWTDDKGISKATFYMQDGDGAYLLYDMPCSKADYDKMTKGSKLKITGYKSIWDGEIEIIEATYEFLPGNYVAPATDVTNKLGTDDLINYMNRFVSFKGMTVEASKDKDGNDVAFLYKWDGSGSEGSDLYFNVSLNGQTYNFVVESYLCGADTDVYKAVKALEIGDKIDLEGYLYWYNTSLNPHITAVKAAD